MAETTISWTQTIDDSGTIYSGYTFNPWRGCARKPGHPGCMRCYAEREAHRFPRIRGVWGPKGTRVLASLSMWKNPIKWNAAAKELGVRLKVFCASIADVFEKWNGYLIDTNGMTICRRVSGNRTGREYWQAMSKPATGWKPVSLQDCRIELFKLIDATPWLDWLLLTKRPELIGDMWPKNSDERTAELWGKHPGGNSEVFRPNVWLGCSISDQPTANRYLPVLKACRGYAKYLWISAEPLTGPITESLSDESWRWGDFNWVVIGGESGSVKRGLSLDIINQPKEKYARPCQDDWMEEIIDECPESTPVFNKQTGNFFRMRIESMRSVRYPAVRKLIDQGFPIWRNPVNTIEYVEWFPPGKGEDPALLPEWVRVQDFPK